MHTLRLPQNQPIIYPLVTTETSDTEITTTEIIKRRDVGPYGIRSEYCIRKIICPLGVPETPKGDIHVLLMMMDFFFNIMFKYAFDLCNLPAMCRNSHTSAKGASLQRSAAQEARACQADRPGGD